MSLLKKFNSKLKGFTNAVFRFPLTTLFLVAAAVMNAYAINTGQNHSKWLLTFVVGAFLSAVFQAIYERFFSKVLARVMLMGIAALLTAGYYLIIMSAPELSIETQIRTAVSLFALFIAFIWVPAIKSNISFNKNFMIAFKSFFHSLFFSVIIFIGVWIILIAADMLIFPVDSKSYLHVANIVFNCIRYHFFIPIRNRRIWLDFIIFQHMVFHKGIFKHIRLAYSADGESIHWRHNGNGGEHNQHPGNDPIFLYRQKA
ncbi:hypothetical protein [Neobacillus fumarioli]|uniref:hypothetical protein n=1 Tax=Neobacillus fumarioli TaxID=105229 RepID=UPI000A755FDC|nr:hypothetical protein [Neobacillus fumarioli]